MNINGIDGKIIKKEGKKTAVEIDGQQISVASELLPPSAKVGETVKLYFFAAADGELLEKKIAKHILEEILNGK